MPQARRFPRIPAEHTVLVRELADAGPSEEMFARTRVVGLGGCMFVYPESIGAGVRVELLISLGLRVLRAVARVVYELPVAEGLEIGVEFLDVAEADRALLEGLFRDTAGTR